jgi:L-fuconolactonase
MNRRQLMTIAAGAVTQALAKPPESIPIIDTHIHLYDPRRPQGVPWPPKDDKVITPVALPDVYRKITDGLGIVGAIEVECSPWFEDNQWVLDIAAKDSLIVGTIGNIDPTQADFGSRFEQLRRNRLFRGVRYGNLWGRNFSEGISKPQVISNLKLVADAGLTMDTANPDAELLASAVRLSDKVPSLRIVIDHLPQYELPQDPHAREAVQAALRELGQRPQVYIKMSEVLHAVNGRVHLDLAFYQARLDEIWDTYGPDRLIYGSDWPNSDHSAPLVQELRVVREYIADKGKVATEKLFWRNSVAAYRWIKRDSTQPNLS